MLFNGENPRAGMFSCNLKMRSYSLSQSLFGLFSSIYQANVSAVSSAREDFGFCFQVPVIN